MPIIRIGRELNIKDFVPAGGEDADLGAGSQALKVNDATVARIGFIRNRVGIGVTHVKADGGDENRAALVSGGIGRGHENIHAYRVRAVACGGS